MPKTRFVLLTAVVFLMVATYSCSQGQQAASPPEQTQAASDVQAAATVNGAPIPLSELETAVRNVVIQNGMGFSDSDAFMAQFGPRILQQLIDGELLYQEASREKFGASEQEVEEAFASLSGRYESPEQFQAEMENRGFTAESLKNSMKKQITIQNFIEGTIVKEAIVPVEVVREAYDQNPQNFSRPEEIKASHILIKSAESDPQEKKDAARKRAAELSAKAREKGADFAELARNNSEGPSAPSGGDLGFFSAGRMVKPFEEAAFALKVNEVSDPVLTQFGYHVIKVTDRRQATVVSFEEAREELEADLKNRMVNELIGRKLSDLREKAEIQVQFNPEPPPAASGNPDAPQIK